ncbi:hypothetical protein CAOG_02399 [Capsaspora owczarzaki ATCC 30864]|uniref:Transcription factor Pcc1 n=1 Tax=Capsaspora owczarzaki (strain ATCC 30864) TaxID=595528 RepID=A0A0D2WM97_CAPO3|nr:hypothetical protein CAOG_02399 [Capsaspora owczarzaki ATCC 30864]KJE91233.1 hypothetical protein CAOG_002399 [Capsaspora owczarzaki ATCC 30864]|eukprot:XP_004349149.1 hypothetical protein CAOG_02399 [Capsaspora owczarzaki ATCC 30864]
MADEFPWCLTIDVPFPTARLATIAYNTLVVDEEPKKSDVRKTLQLLQNDTVLSIHFAAREGRLLRSATQSMMNFLRLTIDTMLAFPDYAR